VFLKSIKRKISFSFLVSVLLHLTFLNVYLKSPTNHLLEESVKPKSISRISLEEIKFIKKSELQKIKQQIVETEQKGNLNKPDEKKPLFLGKTSQFFDRQTIARNNGKFNEGESSVPQRAKGNKSASNNIRSKEIKVKLSLSELGQFSKDDFQKVEPFEKETITNQRSVSSSNDYVEDIPLGDFTRLNTTEYKYFGFYQRIKQKLEQHWGATIQEKAKRLYKSGRRLPASDNLITAIMVVLDGKGKVVDIKIEGSSGIRELDQAAIESFNKAGPFPNPPKGLVVDGRAIIQWGFVVKS